MIYIELAPWKTHESKLMNIRETVFVREQGVPSTEELDELDAVATHFLAFNDSEPVATARVVIAAAEQVAQIGRMAVLKSFRGQGIGAQMLLAVEHWIAQNTQMKSILLHAQTHALDFYRKQGYQVCSDIFIEAGIEHREMKKSLTPTSEHG
jgi:predicted GNAT family N-acyltransferase